MTLQRAANETVNAARRYAHQPSFETEHAFEDALLQLHVQLVVRCTRRGTPPEESRMLQRTQALWAALRDAPHLPDPSAQHSRPLDSSFEKPGS